MPLHHLNIYIWRLSTYVSTTYKVLKLVLHNTIQPKILYLHNNFLKHLIMIQEVMYLQLKPSVEKKRKTKKKQKKKVSEFCCFYIVSVSILQPLDIYLFLVKVVPLYFVLVYPSNTKHAKQYGNTVPLRAISSSIWRLSTRGNTKK